jgi:hypothetical protein
MLRMLACALLVPFLLTVGVEAQRSGGGLHAGGFRGFGPSFGGYGGVGQRGFYGRNSAYGWGEAYVYPAFLPDDESSGQPPAEPLGNEAAPPSMYDRPEAERLPADPQTIELPSVTAPSPSQLPPATMFVLTSGERVEARRFVLTTSDLSLTVNRTERTIPLTSLDLDRTLAANRERGIHLQIPTDHNEISLSF